MAGAIKHLVWAISLVACCYLVTARNWVPVSFTIAPGASNPPVAPTAGTAAAAVAPVASGAGAEAGIVTPVAPSAAAALPSLAVPAATANAAYATIEDANVARQVTDTLAKLEAVVDVPAGTPAGQVATIFFDPRCPYCHAAFTALHGRIAARWVPVVVLGDPDGGNRMAAAILSGPDRVAALADAFAAKTAPSAPVLPEVAAALAGNKEALASIFAAAPQLRPGVPTMFVPRPDGRLAIMVGYEAGDDAKLRAVLTGS